MYIENILKQLGPGLYGITGPAGSGKTSLARRLGNALEAGVYSSDLRFIGSSQDRKELLYRKQKSSIEDYIDAANQFNWWDWDTILEDLQGLSSGKQIVLKNGYDRDKGVTIPDCIVSPFSFTLYEGAILGPPIILSKLRKVIYVHTAPEIRFNRLVAKDHNRRSFREIAARFLITEYSESKAYEQLFAWYRDNVIFVNDQGEETLYNPQAQPNFIPIAV